MFLDPLNPQSDLSARFLALFENIVGTDPAYRVRLERHYAMWKSVIDDPEHPEGSVRRARTPVVPRGWEAAGADSRNSREPTPRFRHL